MDNDNTDTLEAEFEQLTMEAAPDMAVIQQEAVAGEATENAKAEYLGIFKMALTPLPPVMCPNWGIQPAEIDALCDAYATACAKQWPDGVGELGPWAGAALCTVAVLGPRIGTPRVKPKPKEKAPEKDKGVIDASAED